MGNTDGAIFESRLSSDGKRHRQKMIRHTELGTTESKQKREILKLIKNGNVSFAGNRKLKIYGRLDCGSGKRMKPETRVLFKDEYL